VAQQLVIQPRRHRRHRPHRRRGPALAALATAGAGARSTEPPRLALAEPDDPRSRLVTGAITALAHAALLAALLVAAALAPPELIERVIPVELVPLRPVETPVELPGANVEPAPAGPKAVGARRANAAELAARQILTPKQAADMRRDALAAAQRAIDKLNMEAAAAAPTLPREIARREVRADRVQARSSARVAPTAVVDPLAVEPVRIDPADLAVRAPALEGPRTIDPESVTELSGAEAMAALDALPETDYDAGAVQSSGT